MKRLVVIFSILFSLNAYSNELCRLVESIDLNSWKCSKGGCTAHIASTRSVSTYLILKGDKLSVEQRSISLRRGFMTQETPAFQHACFLGVYNQLAFNNITNLLEGIR